MRRPFPWRLRAHLAANAFRLLGAIDLRAGRAVHAVAGQRRDLYQPVAIVEGDAIALAQLYRDRGVNELYVADLDAIIGEPPEDDTVRALTALGLPVSLDGGISHEAQALHAVNALGASQVVVGLETLTSFEALDVICASIGGARVAFSLDLKGGVPLAGRLNATPASPQLTKTAPLSPAAIAARAAQAGVGAVIVLDLARVGTEAGLDFELIAGVRGAVPGVELLAAGGVRGLEDLARLVDLGCNGAIVASMLQYVNR
jgi:phosphoribosylformimino-5-aminoimidazole carboxamide ribotide isomerase